MNLFDYVKVYKNVIKNTEDVLKELESFNFEQHSYYNKYTDTNRTHDKDLSVTYEQPSNVNDIMDTIWNCIYNYTNKDVKSLYTAWKGFTPPRFNKYDTNTLMLEHIDHIYNIFDGERRGIPTLTILGLLNDNYEGGDFILCGEKVEFKEADIIIFPSVFMYPHKVNEITKGTRYSFVSWVW